MTIQIDDAGYGDLLNGVVIGAYRPEKDFFIYDVVGVDYWQNPLYATGKYKNEAGHIALRLIERLMPEIDERIEICQGNLLDEANTIISEKLGKNRLIRCKIEGRAQYLTENAYLDELRNLGYEPLEERSSKWAKSFWDMMHWVEKDPKNRIRWTKSGWPKLRRYRLFRSLK
jgi:hypothetical protein